MVLYYHKIVDSQFSTFRTCIQDIYLALYYSSVHTMKIINIPFQQTHWNSIPKVEHIGETGTSFWKVKEIANFRMRIVEYSRNFKADHWCKKGHLLYVLKGVIEIEMKNGETYQLGEADSFVVGDDRQNPHIISSDFGAKVLIID